jgi:hypothetical protein
LTPSQATIKSASGNSERCCTSHSNRTLTPRSSAEEKVEQGLAADSIAMSLHVDRIAALDAEQLSVPSK